MSCVAFLFFQMKLPIIFLLTAALIKAAGLTPVDLQVEFEANPVGVSAKPRLSWKLEGSERGNTQTHYEIIASSSAENLAENEGDFWSVKNEKSANRQLIPWGGKALQDGQTVHWKVLVTDRKNEEKISSAPAQFTVGKVRKFQPALQIATFESSNEVLNGIFQRNVETLKDRLVKYNGGDPAGLGTGHQVQRSARDLMYLFNAIPALDDWSRKVHGEQNELGYFPSGPGQGISIAHSDAGIAVPHALWWMSADTTLISESWEKMEKHMIRRETTDPKIQGVNWGEPLTFKSALTSEFIDLCYFGMTSRLMYELAMPTENPNQSIRYRDYSARIRKNFKKQYLDGKGQLKITGQEAAILAIRSSVMDASSRKPVIDSFLKSIPPLDEVSGLVAKPLLPVLTLTGNQEKAFELVSDPKGPWADPKKANFLASGVAEWMMSSLAGIETRSPGFRQFRIAPQIPKSGALTWVKSSYNAPSGKVTTYWEKKEGGLHLEMSVPSGTLAQLTLPIQEKQKISEGGETLKNAFGVAEMKRDAQTGTIDILVQSGDYHFVIH